MGRYRIHETAERDLNQIWEYGCRNWGLERATSFYDSFMDKFQHIADHPLGYPRVDNLAACCRRCVYNTYSIYYRVEESRVVILGVVRGQSIASRYWTSYQK